MLRGASIVFIVLGIIFIFVGITDPFKLDSFGINIGIAVIGLAQVFLAISMKKLAKLEDTLARYIFKSDKDNIPNIRCEKCGRYYDMDVEECPYCALEKLKSYRHN